MVPEPVQGKSPPVARRSSRSRELKQLYAGGRANTASCSTSPCALEGLNRHAGMHAAGVVIAEKPLWEYVPLLQPAGEDDEIVTQFTMTDVEKAGLVKFDFLGLKTLTVIQTVPGAGQQRTRAKGGGSARHPGHPARRRRGLQDAVARPTRPACSSSSRRGFRELLKKLKPDCFEDIVAAVALYRPGPLEGGMVDDFIDRKHGRKKVEYTHPLLEPILSGHLRRHRLPGAGDADRPGPGRLLAGRRRPAAPRDGQEEGGGHGQGEGRLPRRRQAEADRPRHRRAGLRADGELRRLRLQPQRTRPRTAWITYQTAYLKRHYPPSSSPACCRATRTTSTTSSSSSPRRGPRASPSCGPDVNESDANFTVVMAAAAAESNGQNGKNGKNGTSAETRQATAGEGGQGAEGHLRRRQGHPLRAGGGEGRRAKARWRPSSRRGRPRGASGR